MNVGKETKAFWGDKFIEILDPHKEGHIVRVYPDYWDEKAPEMAEYKKWVGLNGADWNDFNPLLSNDPHRVAEWAEKILKERNT